MRLYAISAAAADRGMSGMLGKPKSVKASATTTTMETAIVPIHPQLRSNQIPLAKMSVSSPKINV
jgi:hypothetical protein